MFGLTGVFLLFFLKMLRIMCSNRMGLAVKTCGIEFSFAFILWI